MPANSSASVPAPGEEVLKKASRIHAIDALRGLAVVLMIGHHFLYDLEVFCSIRVGFLHTTVFFWLQLIFSSLFMFLAGLGSGLTKGKYARAFKVMALAAVITAVTLLFSPGEVIWFGILHFLSISMLFYALIGPYLEKIPWFIALPVYFAIFVVLYLMPPLSVNPPFQYILGPLVYVYGFVSADYYPLIPWLFMFLMGTTLKKPVIEHKLPKWFYRLKCAPLEMIGKNSLIIFLVHQPLILGGIYLVKWVSTLF